MDDVKSEILPVSFFLHQSKEIIQPQKLGKCKPVDVNSLIAETLMAPRGEKRVNLLRLMIE
jgi:hypothetical protein